MSDILPMGVTKPVRSTTRHVLIRDAIRRDGTIMVIYVSKLKKDVHQISTGGSI